VWNPWAWALVTSRPDGSPLKPGENRVTALWSTMAGQWTLIQVGLHKPDQKQVEVVRAIAKEQGVEMPDWAAKASTARRPDGKPIGAIVGAVLFSGDRDPDDVSGYARRWVSEGATHFWQVERCVAFDRAIPCKGQQAPLFFDVAPEVHMLAQAEMRRLVR
jgi:hypothetical protein